MSLSVRKQGMIHREAQTMTREEILDVCSRAHAVGSVKHSDFADYVVALESRRKIGEQWQTVECAYMSVDGKIAMANEDHRRQGKRLDFAEPKVMADNGEQLTLQVSITSEIYGLRHGIATSRKKGSAPTEREFPWEVAETSAIGRALAAMGYGLLPGAGLASADDILRSQVDKGNPGEVDKQNSNGHGNGNDNGNGHGAHFCSVHQIVLQPRGSGWAHLVKGGGWCYGKSNGASAPVLGIGNGNGSKPKTS
jgi:hypothetical protein